MKPIRYTSTQAPRGFVLVAVIFLLVVLGGAGLVISQLTVRNSATGVQTLQATRAQWLVQAGLDAAILRVINGDPTDCPAAASTHPDFPGLTLTVTCGDERDYDIEYGIKLLMIDATVESTGLSPASREYVWLRQTAVMEVVE